MKNIIIADDGEAIDPELATRIFEPFICGDESRNSKDGSGLGLAIAEKIVEKHHGRLFVDNGISGYTKETCGTCNVDCAYLFDQIAREALYWHPIRPCFMKTGWMRLLI